MSINQLFYLVLIKLILVSSELFTSTTHLTQLLNTEVELSRQLESYLKEEYARLDRVEKYLLLLRKYFYFNIFSSRKGFSI
jgi:hypothetical protein